MSPAPGTQVTIRDEALARFQAQDTAAWFVTGFTARGPHAAPVAVRGLSEFVNIFGPKQAHSQLYDALDVYFREGGGLAYVQRVVGAGAAFAYANLFTDAGTTVPDDVALTIRAKSYGEAANDLTVEVVDAGGGFELILREGSRVLARSGELADVDAAVAWSSRNAYVTVEAGDGDDVPEAQGPTTLGGGTDDHGNAVEDDWTAALDRITKDYGTGQVSAPGRTTGDAHAALAAHAIQFNRMALLDLPDTGVAGDLIAPAADVRDSGNGRAAAAFAPWAVVPGSAPGSTRTVPYSAVQAGLIARSEALGNSPNVAAAGANGEATYVSGLSQPAWSDGDRESLNDAGVNVAREQRGAVRTYGYRTLVDPMGDPEWRELGGARAAMAIAADAEDIAEDFVFAEVDGKGVKVGEFGGRLNAMCLTYYERNALYGDTPEEAFFVDTGPSVNTPATLDDGKLLARIELATSPTAERVEITIVKTS
jgi:uncharacterized protein